MYYRSPVLREWLAPQSDWGSNPYADLDHGAYQCKLTEQSPQQLEIVLTSPVCRETGLQLVRTLTCIDGEPYMDIEQKLVNCGETAVTKGLWQVTMLNRPGTALIPEGEALAEPPIVMFRPEDAAAEQVSGGMQMVLHEAKEFKMGFVSDAGWTSASYEAANANTYTLTKRFRVEADRDYPHGTVIEVYNAGAYPYYELEVHSPAYILQPGESASFTVRWELQAAATEV